MSRDITMARITIDSLIVEPGTRARGTLERSTEWTEPRSASQ